MNNELKPCPFNIGDKVNVKTNRREFMGIVSEISFLFGDWSFKVAMSFYKDGGPNKSYMCRSLDMKLIECPDTLEAVANEKWQWWGGSDEEYYEAGPYGCRDEAIEVIVDEGDYDEGFYIMEAIEGSLNFNARKLIEDQYFEKEDYFSRDRCEPDRRGDHVAADKELQKLLDDWVIKHQSTFVKPDIFSKTRNAEFIDAQTILKLKGEL